MKKQSIQYWRAVMLATAAILIMLGALSFAGCGLISGNNPTTTIRKYYSYADASKPEEMVKLFSDGYLSKNPNALEKSRAFVSFVRKDTPADSKIVLSNLSEKIEGEIAAVKGEYGLTGITETRSFEAILYRINGEWKIESLINH